MGRWASAFGECELGIAPTPQSQIPKTQSPIPNSIK